MSPLFANRWLIAIPSIWLVAAGALITLVVLLAVWAILLVVAPRAAAEARTSLRDGFAGPMAWLLITLAATAIALAPLVPIGQIWRSLVRLTAADTASVIVTVPPGASLQEIPLELRPQELASISLESDTPLVVRTQQPIEGFALSKLPDVELDSANNNRWKWNRAEGATNPFLGLKAKLEATNTSDKPVRLTASWRLVPEFPQAAILPWTVVTLLSLAAAYGLFRLVPRRIAAVASATTKEAIGQPIFSVALIVGFFLLQHEPHGFDVLAGIAPIAERF